MNEMKKRIATELWRVLENGPYRAGTLVLTMEPNEPNEPGQHVRILSAVMMNGIGKEQAVDMVLMIRYLRDLANDIEAVVKGNAPLPEQP